MKRARRTIPRGVGWLVLVWGTLVAFVWAGSRADAYPEKPVRARPAGADIQRTLRLLRSSRPGRRSTVRVLFYGQSITEQRWSAEVQALLRRRYPHAHLVVENRALGGFASQLLVQAAETDLYPFYPDLLIFHVYGAHDRYEDIIRRVRERTTAEIMLQTDHLQRPEELLEETDPARLPLGQSDWAAFMNHAFLPQLAQRYHAGLCDQRTVWKRYLTQHQLAPQALLADHVHLNAHGEWLMGRCVEDCLRESAQRSVAEDWVRTYELGKDLHPEAESLRLRFAGNRVDVVLDPNRVGGAVEVRIDGRKPSAWPELYGFTRARGQPGGKWPPVFGLASRAPLLLERWTLDVTREEGEGERYRFSLHGSQTGFDGEGRSDTTFVSNSGRVVIEPSDWVVGYALSLAGVTRVPARFAVSFDVVPYFLDEFVPPPAPGPGLEAALTLAQGLPNTEHELELYGDVASVRALRVYRPPLRAATDQTSSADAERPPRTAVERVPMPE